ncbi:MAG TPA: DNA-processing protein DprA [Vicinamibacterales bacterium]|jgi:DNA processing protein
MLALEDYVALSGWWKPRRTEVPDFLRRSSDDLVLEQVIDAVRPGLAPDAIAARLRTRAAHDLAKAASLDILTIPWGDPRYPRLLGAIPDPPLVLWLKGQPESLHRPCVAMVGSRAASPYGLEVVSRLAGELAAAGATIVSGLARGVDSAGHRAALGADGDTVAVLGSGPDIVYPPEHGALAATIAERGALVSEWPPGTPPERFRFPARNRIISGLSLAVIVIEAAEKSGSLITAEFALSQGREVMAVPGSVLSGRHTGCHHLLRDGATLVETSGDVLAVLRTSSLRPLLESSGQSTVLDNPILSAMVAGESYDLDGIGRQTGQTPAQLLPGLLELELQGSIRRVRSGRFVRAGRTC